MSDDSAPISGQGILKAFFLLIIVGAIFGLLWWLVQYMNLPQPFDKVANIGLAIAAVLFLINFLLSLVGKAFIKW